MKVVLKINTHGNINKQTIELQRTTTFGRSSKNAVKVNDDKISSHHCRLFLKEDGLEVTDLDSKNGTYLNGFLVEQSEVFIGDEIKIGDTLISLYDEEFDAEALEFLTFPGAFKDRLNYELKVDFTGARVQNQLMNRQNKVIPKKAAAASHEKEIEIRKKAQSKIRLTKEGIKSRNKFLSFLALMTDYLFMGAFMTMPIAVFITGRIATLDQNLKITAVIVSEIVIISAFIYLNFKITKFSIGERFCGIKAKYQNQ